VARLASLRKVSSYVIRICRLLEVRQVAAGTCGGSPREFAADVAGSAFQRSVRSGQSKAGLLQMVELRIQPTVHPMALLAGSWEPAAYVAGLRILVILGMAGIALRGQSLKLPHRSALVTRVAIESGVSAHKRETVLVLIDLLD
jgi:hypothetical protein